MGIVIEGITCDLNHHIPAYQQVALITLADWTVQSTAVWDLWTA
jgi:hypothetical protein